MEKHKGFGLLEILITLVLLGVGVAGLVSLAKGMLGTAREGGRYEIAMRLAESRLDEFRNFNAVRTASPPLTAYKDITAGNGSQPLSNDSYGLSWMVSDQYLDGGAWTTTKPATYFYDYPQRKLIVVTVTWDDNSGDQRSLQLAGAISPTGSFTKEETGDGLVKPRDGPKVTYNPGAAPDVISIDLGNGSKQETSKPAPTVTAKNDVVGKEIQFDTVIYKALGQENQIQQDITSVSCSCSYGSSLTSYLPAQAYSTTTNQLYWKIGAQQSKQTGTVDGNQQPTLCSKCCQHHFDGTDSSFTSYYAPLNTDRKRYNSSLTQVGSGSYIDACRFVRLDGYYSPMPDWNLVKVIVTTSDFLAKTANQVSYQNYIKDVVKAYIDWQKQTLNWTPTATATAPAITEFDDWLNTSPNVAPGGDTTTGITVSTGTRQLIARGIYVDILNPTYLAGIDTSATDYLAKVPFQDINLTMLAEWSIPTLSDYGPIPAVTPVAPPLMLLTGNSTDYLAVTNEEIDTIINIDNYYFGKYSRGYLHAKQVTKDLNGNLQGVKVKATVYQGNSGITASLVSPVDRDNALSGELLVAIDSSVAAQPLLTVTGKIECLAQTNSNNPAPKACQNGVFNNLIPNTSTAGASCSIQKPQGNSDVALYSCTAPQGSTLVVNFSIPSGFQINPAGSLSITMDPPVSGQVISGPCRLMVESGVTNANNLTCSP